MCVCVLVTICFIFFRKSVLEVSDTDSEFGGKKTKKPVASDSDDDIMDKPKPPGKIFMYFHIFIDQ